MDKELLKFVEHHKIDLDDLYDANGLSVSKVKNDMKMLDKLFAYNTTPCQKGNHTLRDINTHCIICGPANIEFLKRSRKTGYVYIAGSLIKEYIKIGMTTEKIDDRMSKLNSRKVGNTNDWVVIKVVKCDNATTNENNIQKLLGKYKVDGDFYGKVESNEIFRCGFAKANEVLENYFNENDIKKHETKTFLNNTEKYNFKNLVYKDRSDM